MIEDVLQTQPKAQKLVEKSSTRNSEFEKYLKETTQNLEGLTTKSTTQVAAKPTQVKDTKESKTTPKDSPKLAESTQKSLKDIEVNINLLAGSIDEICHNAQESTHTFETLIQKSEDSKQNLKNIQDALQVITQSVSTQNTTTLNLSSQIQHMIQSYQHIHSLITQSAQYLKQI